MSFMIKQEWRIAIKKLIVPIIFVFLLVYVNLTAISWVEDYGTIKAMATAHPMQIMRYTQQIVQIVFGGLIAISVSVFWNLRSGNFLSLVVGNRSQFMRILFAKWSVPVTLGLLLMVNAAAYDLFWLLIGKNLYSKFLLHLLKCWLLNGIIPTLIAAQVGLLLVLLCKSLSRVIFALLICFFTFGGAIGIVFFGSSLDNPWIYKIVDIFAIYPVGLQYWPDSIYGFSAENYRFAIGMFWLTVTIILIYFKLKDRNRVSSLVNSIPFFVAAIILLVYIILPNGAVRKGQSYKISQNFFYDSGAVYPTADQLMVFSHAPFSETEANFIVSRYDLTIDITHQLNVTAVIDVQNTGDSMIFSLYYGYKVLSVCDQDSNKLDFVQNADALVIQNTRTVTQVTIVYRGYCYGFYSNDQAMFLPGDFAWYPVPGYHHTLVNNALSWYGNVYLKNAVPFTIKVDAPYTVYSALNTEDHRMFTGVTTRPTLVGGLVEEKEIGGLHTIYSPVAEKNNVFPTEVIYKALVDLCHKYETVLPKNFSYTYIQQPDTLTIDTYYCEEHAIVATQTSPKEIAVGIAAWILGDENEPATHLLREYMNCGIDFIPKFQGKEPQSEMEQLYYDWAVFAASHGIDFTVDKTIDYVLQQKKGGIINFLQAQIVDLSEAK